MKKIEVIIDGIILIAAVFVVVYIGTFKEHSAISNYDIVVSNMATATMLFISLKK